MNTQTSEVYRAFERFWHWTQAALIFLLALTGFEIHGTLSVFGYRQAVAYHNAAAIGFLILIAFAIFWHFTTGEWRQYIPTRRMLRAQIEYYLNGIFRNAAHPTRKDAGNKLNPLQRVVYLFLKVLVIPVMGASGLLYMFNRYPQWHGTALLGSGGLKFVAILHTAGAFFLVSFVIGHIYLTTTGETPLANLYAMLTGQEEIEPEPCEPVTSANSRSGLIEGQA